MPRAKKVKFFHFSVPPDNQERKEHPQNQHPSTPQGPQRVSPAAFLSDADLAAAAAIQPVEPVKVPGGQRADQGPRLGPVDVSQGDALPLEQGRQALGIYSFNLDYNILL